MSLATHCIPRPVVRLAVHAGVAFGQDEPRLPPATPACTALVNGPGPRLEVRKAGSPSRSLFSIFPMAPPGAGALWVVCHEFFRLHQAFVQSADPDAQHPAVNPGPSTRPPRSSNSGRSSAAGAQEARSRRRPVRTHFLGRRTGAGQGLHHRAVESLVGSTGHYPARQRSSGHC